MDKLKSKKFWVLVVTLVFAMVGGGGLDPALGEALNLDPLAIGIAGLVSTAYIVVQGRIDRTTAIGKALSSVDIQQLKKLIGELEKAKPAQVMLPPEPPEDDVSW